VKWISIPPSVEFKSTGEFYKKEKSGIKPNTVRVVNAFGLRYAEVAVFITIIDTATGDHFTRKITDLSLLGNVLGKPLIVISWDSKEVIS
jgi:hypothetical protein